VTLLLSSAEDRGCPRQRPVQGDDRAPRPGSAHSARSAPLFALRLVPGKRSRLRAIDPPRWPCRHEEAPTSYWSTVLGLALSSRPSVSCHTAAGGRWWRRRQGLRAGLVRRRRRGASAGRRERRGGWGGSSGGGSRSSHRPQRVKAEGGVLSCCRSRRRSREAGARTGPRRDPPTRPGQLPHRTDYSGCAGFRIARPLIRRRAARQDRHRSPAFDAAGTRPLHGPGIPRCEHRTASGRALSRGGRRHLLIRSSSSKREPGPSQLRRSAPNDITDDPGHKHSRAKATSTSRRSAPIAGLLVPQADFVPDQASGPPRP
jgi:hypothetical protein